MGKMICGLLVSLAVFCVMAASFPTVDARKVDEIVHNRIHSVTVQRDGDKWSIKWQYQGLEGTKVKINLYENGQLKQTIAENITIGQNGRGTWDWGNRGSWDWGNRGTGDDYFSRGKEYKIEIVSMTDANLRIMSEKIDDDHSRR